MSFVESRRALWGLLVVLFAIFGCKQEQKTPPAGDNNALAATMVAETLAAEKAGNANAATSAYNAAQSSVSASRETAITRAVRRVANAVVGINVTQIREYRRRSIFDSDPFFREFFGHLPYRKNLPVKSLGSGLVFDKDGLVITNEHVVHNAIEILVTLTDGTKHEADLIGSDFISDIALLKIRNPKDLTTVTFANSDDILIGEWTIALGNPFGLFDVNAEPIVTVGVVSALDQDFGRVQKRVYKDMIQTDASINPGNSGGPLVNALGEVIGMNTFIFSGDNSSGSIGVGFAIPSKRILKIVNELQKNGQVNRSFRTGIEVEDISPMVARYLGLQSTTGVIITNIQKNSPALKAGLKPGDVILEFNSEKIGSTADIMSVIEQADLRGGDRVVFTIYRDGKSLKVPVTLAPTKE